MKKFFILPAVISFMLVTMIPFSAFAAFDVFLIHLSTKAKVMDWRFVEKSARSVPGIEKTEINKSANTLSIYCKEKCTDQILKGLENKLKTKGIILQKGARVQPVPPKL